MKNIEKSKDGAQCVFCLTSSSNVNVKAAIGEGRWAYTQKQKRHGPIKSGDYIMLYSAQSGCIECVGIVLGKPEADLEVRDLWEGTFYNPLNLWL